MQGVPTRTPEGVDSDDQPQRRLRQRRWSDGDRGGPARPGGVRAGRRTATRRGRVRDRRRRPGDAWLAMDEPFELAPSVLVASLRVTAGPETGDEFEAHLRVGRKVSD
jgi:hypothetical protein